MKKHAELVVITRTYDLTPCRRPPRSVLLSRIGLLRGDETDWEPVEICDGAIPAGLGLAAEEFAWLAGVWHRTTGERLKPTWLKRFERLVAQYALRDAN